jgi:hypothetical protein
MNKKNLLHLIFFISGALTAILAICAYPVFTGEEKVDGELWIAKANIIAYHAPAESGKQILYEIKKDEACIPLKTLTTKAHLYINVLCEYGEGWIHSRSNFDTIKTKEQKHKSPY